MPPSGATQGILSAVMLNQKVKQSLDAGFPKLVEENPKQVFVRLAFAAFLSEAGKGDEAWREFHEAEKGGLCDATSGGRHPLAPMLDEEVGRARLPGRVRRQRPRRAGEEVRRESRARGPQDPHRAAHRAARHRSPAEGRREGHHDPEDLGKLERPSASTSRPTRTNPDVLAAALPRGRARDRARAVTRRPPTSSRRLRRSSPTSSRRSSRSPRPGSAPGTSAGAAQDYLKYAREVEPGKKTRAFFESSPRATRRASRRSPRRSRRTGRPSRRTPACARTSRCSGLSRATAPGAQTAARRGGAPRPRGASRLAECRDDRSPSASRSPTRASPRASRSRGRWTARRRTARARFARLDSKRLATDRDLLAEGRVPQLLLACRR